MSEENPRLVDSITVQQDVGTYEPVWKKIALDLYSDGTVRWRPPVDVEGVRADHG